MVLEKSTVLLKWIFSLSLTHPPLPSPLPPICRPQILVTSNDSRIRLYDLRDLSLSMKYKGYVNSSSQIKASFRWRPAHRVWNQSAVGVGGVAGGLGGDVNMDHIFS